MEDIKNIKKLIRFLVPCVGKWNCRISSENPFYELYSKQGYIDCPLLRECLCKYGAGLFSKKTISSSVVYNRKAKRFALERAQKKMEEK
jgi:hypothetical protein